MKKFYDLVLPESGGEWQPIFGEWQLCPKCLGDGKVITHGGLTTSISQQCDVCNGAKIIAKPIINQTYQSSD